ncbi:MAG: aminotransferase class IV [Prevotella sp.]|nr:aminotransferase class IV [Prevotella sp.]
MEHGVPTNLSYHLNRIRRTRMHFWNSEKELNADELLASVVPCPGISKLRFLYDASHFYDIDCTPYEMRRVDSLKIVSDATIDYPFKREDRDDLNRLRTLRDQCDDVLIVKDNHITDTSYTNVAFFDGLHWITPDTPLLPGTRREYLLDTQKIIEEEITLSDISRFTHLAMFNAMIDLGELVIPTSHLML